MFDTPGLFFGGSASLLEVIMGKETYFEQLKTPAWQKKRLEVLQRDGFQCQNCGDKESELNVHHIFYDPELKAWEYPDQAYMTLCKNCHEKWHETKRLIDQLFCKMNIERMSKIFAIIFYVGMRDDKTIDIFYKMIAGYDYIDTKDITEDSEGGF
jgi:hypothetical protein